MSDFKTNEYANLIGGRQFEPSEENPMIGFRGASRYYDERYREGFALECQAIKRAREEMGLSNIIIMIPFCRTLEEADKVLAECAKNGLKRGQNGLQIYVMCEIPSNVILAEEFAERFDGFSIGSNDLTQLTLGVDRDSGNLSKLFDERNLAVKRMIESVIQSAHKSGTKVGICGQAPSDYPDFTEFLINCGIDSISLNPDSVIPVSYTHLDVYKRQGLPMETLWQIVQSMQKAAKAAGVQLVTGDTKVVEKGKGDGIFINTAGVGIIEHELSIQPKSVKPGDAVLVSGDLGRHGIAIMAQRENLSFESEIESDCAPLAGIVQKLLDAGIEIHCLRDLTRGGLASALCEISESAKVQIQIDESVIPVREDVRGACEILGFDPLYVANEGRFVAFVPAADAERALGILKKHALGKGATIIGTVREHESGLVTAKSKIGTTRIVDMISGEQLPRIC